MLLPLWDLVLCYFLDILLYEVAPGSCLLARGATVVIEGCDLGVVLLVDEPSFSGSSGCCFLVDLLEALDVL